MQRRASTVSDLVYYYYSLIGELARMIPSFQAQLQDRSKSQRKNLVRGSLVGCGISN